MTCRESIHIFKPHPLKSIIIPTLTLILKKLVQLQPLSHRRGGPLRCLYGINRSGTAMIAVVPQWFHSGSVIDRRSTVENCQNRGPSRWHGGNFEHVQNSRSATAGWANPQRDRRSTAMTAVAPPSHDRSTITVLSRKSRLATLRRSCGGSTAVMVRRVGETMKNYCQCHYGDGGFDLKP